MIGRIGVLMTLLVALCASLPARAAQDPAVACGIKKVKVLNKYEKCLDKAMLAFPLDTRADRRAKCHEKCTDAFTKVEEQYECQQEGVVASYCGPTSATFAKADCRQDYFLFGSSSCYP